MVDGSPKGFANARYQCRPTMEVIVGKLDGKVAVITGGSSGMALAGGKLFIDDLHELGTAAAIEADKKRRGRG
jgi:hypothetical protein